MDREAIYEDDKPGYIMDTLETWAQKRGLSQTNPITVAEAYKLFSVSDLEDFLIDLLEIAGYVK